jgi:tetratricopeptide (TPR) repeat protein
VSLAGVLTPQLLPAVQRGYALAQRGAMYAARAEFVQVLSRVVQAKDAAANSDAHSQGLAAGLRAIDEAEDFVPNGARVEAEIDVRIVASSHRTPVLGELPMEVSPHEAMAMYHQYAQQQLAAAVAGEQAGSMALHGLGKVAATLAQRGSGDPALVRSATTMYSAALMSCPMNHLAANELGVLLVREGRAGEAARLFERTIDLAPSATAYHNLAIAQGKLGIHGEAAANEQESQRLAAMERLTGAVSRRAGIQWVTPDQLSGVAQPGLTPTAQVPPRKKSVWEKTKEMASSLPLVGGTKTR